MNKSGYSSVILVSMLFLGVGMVLSRGWLNDAQGFVKDKVGGGTPTPQKPTVSPPSVSGFNNGSSGDPRAGASNNGIVQSRQGAW